MKKPSSDLSSLLNRTFRLSNGDFSTHLTPQGGGHLTARSCWLTSFRNSLDDGVFFYLRDTHTRSSFWSATLHPTLSTPDRYDVRVFPSLVEFIRHSNLIETRLSVGLPSHGSWEMRRLIVTNNDRYPRIIEVSSALDITLLYDRWRDIDHQTFSNLFIGSTFDERYRALIFHRRSFARQENFPLFSHHIVADPHAEFVGFDTARETFLGRGHGFEWPASILENTENSVGYTLDPIASIRYRTTLDPGMSATFYSFQAAHFAPDTPDHFLETFSRPENAAHMAEKIFPPREQPSETFTFSHSDMAHLFPAPKKPQGSPSQAARPSDTECLRFWNGFGGFDPETSDYHIRFDPKTGLPPQPWSNILCNRNFGMIATENSIGGTWHQDSRTNRLTPWSNDPVIDPPVEILYLKDRATGSVFSATPAPFLDASYDIVHGRGFTRYDGRHGAIRHCLTVFVEQDLPVKHLLLELENEGLRPIEVSIAHFLDYPAKSDDSTTITAPQCRHEHNALCLPLPDDRKGDRYIAVFSSEPIHRYATSKERFFGPTKSNLFPKQFIEDAVADGSDVPSTVMDSCAVFQTADIGLAPGEKRSVTFSLVSATAHDRLDNILGRFPIPDRIRNIETSLETTRKSWKSTLSAVHIDTPEPTLDTLFNDWIPYQILSSRLWGRTAFYQSSGAFGYRDQLQDVLALLHIDPSLARTHIIHCACQQYEDGNTRWWWFPENDMGIRSHSSDNPLWLAFAAAEYVRFTGDTDIWNATTPYLRPADPQDPEVAPGHPTEYHESLWDHCQRAIEYTLKFGAKGLPLIREGDWNDGMNTVGHEGRGESVWLGFFLAQILATYIPLLEVRMKRSAATDPDHRSQDTLRCFRYRTILHDLRKNLDRNSWDGQWFLRAFYDDGTPLGSHKNQDCRIDSISQSWSVLSGIATDDRARQAMQSLWKHLYDPASHTLRLLDPPFDRDPHTPGYVKDYPPGIRENGAQYNHATLWAAQAFAALGDAAHAWEALTCTNPLSRSDTPEKIATYQTEPYAVAADIYTTGSHAGMGGWTWYTASAGLFYRTVIESVFGLKRTDDRITVHPCLPADWHDATIELSIRSSRYRIRFSAGQDHANKIESMTIDGRPVDPDAPVIPISSDNLRHDIEIRLR